MSSRNSDTILSRLFGLALWGKTSDTHSLNQGSTNDSLTNFTLQQRQRTEHHLIDTNNQFYQNDATINSSWNGGKQKSDSGGGSDIIGNDINNHHNNHHNHNNMNKMSTEKETKAKKDMKSRTHSPISYLQSHSSSSNALRQYIMDNDDRYVLNSNNYSDTEVKKIMNDATDRKKAKVIKELQMKMNFPKPIPIHPQNQQSKIHRLSIKNDKTEIHPHHPSVNEHEEELIVSNKNNQLTKNEVKNSPIIQTIKPKVIALADSITEARNEMKAVDVSSTIDSSINRQSAFRTVHNRYPHSMSHTQYTYGVPMSGNINDQMSPTRNHIIKIESNLPSQSDLFHGQNFAPQNETVSTTVATNFDSRKYPNIDSIPKSNISSNNINVSSDLRNTSHDRNVVLLLPGQVNHKLSQMNRQSSEPLFG